MKVDDTTQKKIFSPGDVAIAKSHVRFSDGSEHHTGQRIVVREDTEAYYNVSHRNYDKEVPKQVNTFSIYLKDNPEPTVDKQQRLTFSSFGVDPERLKGWWVARVFPSIPEQRLVEVFDLTVIPENFHKDHNDHYVGIGGKYEEIATVFRSYEEAAVYAKILTETNQGKWFRSRMLRYCVIPIQK